MYFSYDSFYPISLFEMTVALDNSLQNTYIKSATPQDPVGLARCCDVLKTRVFTRCAGLLEIVIDDDDDNSSSLSTPDKQEDVPLLAYHKTTIKYLHRTARDFLLTTKDGQDLLNKPKESFDLRSANLIRAQMASMIQGLTEFCGHSVCIIMQSIMTFSPGNNTELLITLRHICEGLSVPGLPVSNIDYREFWNSCDYINDFESSAAWFGGAEYIQYFIKNKKSFVSPYYLGLLFLSAAKGLVFCDTERHDANLSLISWPGLRKADVWTKHVAGWGGIVEFIHQPASDFLCLILSPEILTNYNLAKQATKTIQQLLPFLIDSVDECLVPIPREKTWSISHKSSWRYPMGPFSIVVYMSAAKLCFLVMQYLEVHAAYKPQWR